MPASATASNDIAVYANEFLTLAAPSMSALTNGQWVVTWQLNNPPSGTGSDIYMLPFYANGVAKDNQAQVANAYLSGNQTNPDILALSPEEGKYVGVWASNEVKQTGESHKIILQLFADDGMYINAEFALDNFTTPGGNVDKPVITALSTGQWLVTWQTTSYVGMGENSLAIKQAVLSYENGVVTNKDVGMVNVATNGAQTQSSVAALNDGSWIVCYTSDLNGDGNTDLFWRGFKMDPHQKIAEIFAETRISTSGTALAGAQSNSSLVQLSNGNIVVTWTSTDTTYNSSDVYQRLYDPASGFIADEMLVNTTSVGNQNTTGSSVAALSGGGWVVVWQSDQGAGSTQATGLDVYMQRYSQTGVKIGTETLVNSVVGGDQKSATVTALMDGSWVVGWVSENEPGIGGTQYNKIVQKHYAPDIIGTGASNTIKGTLWSETIYGMDGNDGLDGGAGADILIGGRGKDYYILGVGDKIIESASASGGVDTVKVSFNYTLGSGLENLVLTGSALNGNGNSLANVIAGSTKNNKLYGYNGNDRISGGAGSDRVYGGSGNDTLYGDAANDMLYGSTGNDKLFGGTGNDTLFGDGGRDSIYGDGGNDQLYGGGDKDVFSFKSSFGRDTIMDFRPGTDDIDLRTIASVKNFAWIKANTFDRGHDTIIHIGSSTITLHNVHESKLHAGDFIF